VQEALTNVRKHSGARRVFVTLRRQAARRYWLVIEDNGRGLAPVSPGAGRTIASSHASGGPSRYPDVARQVRRPPTVIKECADSLEGELVVSSAPGRGLRLEISFPVHSASAVSFDPPVRTLIRKKMAKASSRTLSDLAQAGDIKAFHSQAAGLSARKSRVR
jgi:two-component system nitrate/nitrite sensor histidine kinase NarX